MDLVEEFQNRYERNPKEFGRKLEERTVRFSIVIIKLSGKLPNNPEGNVLRNQLTKSGTSIGANYREANRARSKADFRNRIKICESETSETVYWLSIVERLRWIEEMELIQVIKEAKEFLALFTAISNTSYRNTQKHSNNF
jgi:four helix bundle protein